MSSSLETASAKFTLSVILLSFATCASAGPKEDVAAAVRSDRSALRDYFVTAFRVLPGLKVSFGDQLIRMYGGTAVNIPAIIPLPTSRTEKSRYSPRATALLT
jgi:hypothetical protein